MQPWVKMGAIAGAVGLVSLAVWRFFNPGPESNPIIADGGESVVILPFSEITSFSDLPLGWAVEQILMRPPMGLSWREKDGVPSLRCETNAGGSTLSRTAEVEIGDYPILVWNWRVDIPISSPADEATPEGDDHPIRLVFDITDQDGNESSFQIIWSNRKYQPGEYKYIGGIPQYVAGGLDENIRTWQAQELDLMDIYREITGRDDYPLLTRAGLLCDSDNTGSRSVAFITDVELRQR